MTLRDQEIRNIEEGRQKKESLSGKGNGALVYRKKGGAITGYYRYWRGKQSIFIKLDNYKLTPKTPGKTSAELRDQALEMVVLKKQVAPVDLKEYLQEQAKERLQKAEEVRKKEEQKSKQGTLEDLFDFYLNYLKDRKSGHYGDAKSAIKINVREPFPELLKKKVCDISEDDLFPLFARAINRGYPAAYNTFRSVMSAAFNRGIKADRDPRLTNVKEKRFGLKANPANLFPMEPKNTLKRRLSHAELRILWGDIEKGVFTGNYPYGMFIQMCIACFGIRPAQLARVQWKDIDAENKTLTFVDMKKNGKTVEVIIPLIPRAYEIINKLKSFRDSVILSDSKQELPIFLTTRFTPVDINKLSDHIREYKSIRTYDEEGKEKWKSRAFRKTANSILTDAGVVREHRYLLQSRSFRNDVEEDHYSDQRLKEKREASEKYSGLLEKILTDDGCIKDREGLIESKLFSYDSFKLQVIESNEIDIQKNYIRYGIPKRQVYRWFKKLEDEGIITKVKQRYVMSSSSYVATQKAGSLPRQQLLTYEDFRNQVLGSVGLRAKHAYTTIGYSQRKINSWFDKLQAEGIIEKVDQRYQLKQPGDSNGHTHDQDGLSASLSLQVSG